MAEVGWIGLARSHCCLPVAVLLHADDTLTLTDLSIVWLIHLRTTYVHCSSRTFMAQNVLSCVMNHYDTTYSTPSFVKVTFTQLIELSRFYCFKISRYRVARLSSYSIFYSMKMILYSGWFVCNYAKLKVKDSTSWNNLGEQVSPHSN